MEGTQYASRQQAIQRSTPAMLGENDRRKKSLTFFLTNLSECDTLLIEDRTTSQLLTINP